MSLSHDTLRAQVPCPVILLLHSVGLLPPVHPLKSAEVRQPSSELPTRWLCFWMYFRLPIVGALWIWAGLAPLIRQTRAATATGIFFSLAAVGIGLWQISIASGLAQRRTWAWRQNWVSLFGGPICFAAWTVLVECSIRAFVAFSFLVIALGLVWCWPNYIYFKKREPLFH